MLLQHYKRRCHLNSRTEEKSIISFKPTIEHKGKWANFFEVAICFDHGSQKHVEPFVAKVS